MIIYSIIFKKKVDSHIDKSQFFQPDHIGLSWVEWANPSNPTRAQSYLA